MPVRLTSLLATNRTWPDMIDAAATAVFLAVVLAVPAAGYAMMVIDFRAYLRSLRRALMRVVSYSAELPEWARQQTPRCVAALGLQMPCTEAQIMSAYRREVKQLHPDRGGDRRRFLILQTHFEQALQLVRRGSE